MNNYASIEPYRFSKMTFKGYLGEGGVFILYGKPRERLIRFTFDRYLAIEAQNEYIKVSTNFWKTQVEVRVDNKLWRSLPYKRHGVRIDLEYDVFSGYNTPGKQFNWFSKKTRSPIILTTTFTPFSDLNEFSFFINDDQIPIRETLIMLGIAFILSPRFSRG